MKTISFFNGNEIAQDTFRDRGSAFADGIFETLFWNGKSFPLLAYHRQRFIRSAVHLTLARSDAAKTLFDAQMARLSSYLSEKFQHRARVKLVLTRGDVSHGCYPSQIFSHEESCEHNLFVTVSDIHSFVQESVELVASPHPLIEHPRLVGLKHLNRLNYILCCEGVSLDKNQHLLLCDANRQIVETMHHNIFFIQGDTIVAPMLKLAGVEGVFKQWLREDFSPKFGLEFVEQTVSFDAVSTFEAAFIGNGISGPVTVGRLFGVNGESFSFMQTHQHVSTIKEAYKQRVFT